MEDKTTWSWYGILSCSIRRSALLPLAIVASCTKPLGLDGHPCPCVRGYTCDESQHICVPDDSVPDAPVPDAPVSNDAFSPVHDGATGDGGSLALGLELLVGDTGGIGNVDGMGAAARFFRPSGLVTDSVGNLYVADTSNHIIRMVTPAGVVTTLAGTPGLCGSADGTGAAARFCSPHGITFDSAGNIYVADTGTSAIRKVTATGVVTTLAGGPGQGSADGTGTAARFTNPSGVAVDSAGNVYVADQSNHTIRKITATAVVTTLAGTAGMPGGADGTGSAARFRFPSDVAADGVGNLYVSDSGNHSIRKVTAEGVVTTLAGNLGLTSGVTTDNVGNLYVADSYSHIILKVTAEGFVTTLAGTADLPGSTDGTGVAVRFNTPCGVAADSTGNIYVADRGNHTIRKITSTGNVTTVAGIASMLGAADGGGAIARFNAPSGIAADGDGSVYVADNGNSTIRKVTAAGVVTTLAGAAGISGSADGTGAAARFDFPFPISVAANSTGDVYIADEFNHTIRKITAGGVVTTLAGTAGMSGSTDGTGAAARFSFPVGVAIDSSGNIYVADSGNFTIRKVTAAGVVTTLAGAARMPGWTNGTGSAARFNNVTGIATDSTGNIYVADQGNANIRRITPAGVVTTLVAFNFRTLSDLFVAADHAGNVYVVVRDNNTIVKVTPTGSATTIAGTAGVSGILLGVRPRFSAPNGLAIVGDSIVISDNNAILLLRHGVE